MYKPLHICVIYNKRKHPAIRFILQLVLLFITGLLAPKTNIAQSIGNWTFNGILTGTAGTHNTLSIADFSSGVPIHTFNGSTEYYGENGWPSGAINTAMYLQFSLTPNMGYELDISSLVLTIRRSNTGTPAGSGPTSWSLRSSLDGFTTDITTGSMTLNYANYTITPGSSFLLLTSAVTFRLYGYNASIGSGGNSRFVIDNITVNGLSSLLPVTMGNLQAGLQHDKVNLSYTVYNTEENSRYFIERSADGIHYTTISSNTETTSAAEKSYLYTDDVQTLYAVPQLYYRVCAIGHSGNPVYTSTVTLKKEVNTIQLKTFITNNQLHINGSFPPAAYRAIIYNTAGQVLSTVLFTATSGYNSFTFSLTKTVPLTSVIHIDNDKGYSGTFLSLNAR